MTTFFGRVYRLRIGASGNPLREIDGFTTADNTPPQLQFGIDQTPHAERSYGEITVYGLNRESRRAVYERGDEVELIAGYREQFSTLFRGSIENVEISRSGPDSYVKLFCQSGVEEWDATVSKTFGVNTPQVEIIRHVAESFGYPVEIVGDFSDLPKAIKGRTLDGGAASYMRGLARSFDFTWMLENGTLVVAREGALRGGAEDYLYTAITGLIGPPEITQKGVDINVMLNPRIRPRDTFRVEAINQQLTFNGIYYQGQDFAETNGKGRNQAISLRHEGDFYADTWQTYIEGRRI